MDWFAFFGFFTACCAAAATGAMFPPGAWYEELERPGWTPPNWLFPVAWMTIYLLISAAGARVAATSCTAVRHPIPYPPQSGSNPRGP